MSLSPDKKEERRVLTLESATALVDDLENIRNVINKIDPTPGEIRRLSAQLRRILVERSLSNVAAPRVGRITLRAPDTKSITSYNKSLPIPFCSVGGGKIFGVEFALSMLENTNSPRNLTNYNPDGRVSLSLDGFLNQGVICFNGTWVSRRDVIKFVANIADGVHSGSIKDDMERLIKKIRHVGKISLENDIPVFSVNLNALSVADLSPIVDRKSVYFVLCELFVSATLLVLSPDVINIEKIIEKEIS